MRHRCGPRKLNITDGAHRRALMRHICNALIDREQINTTLPRAKELRRFIEPLITLGKNPSIHRRRLAFARLQDRDSVAKLFGDLGVRFGARPGGYVRILKNGFRKGDSAPMALVEFVDKAPVAAEPETSAPSAKKSAKTRKSAKKKSAKAATKSAKTVAAAKAEVAESAEAAEDADSAQTAAAESGTSAAAEDSPESADRAKESPKENPEEKQ